MATDKLLVIVPNEDDFKPAQIPFGVITGEGVDNFDGDAKQYSVTLVLGKEENKAFRKTVMEYWEDNKPKGAGDEPDNWQNITRKDKEVKGQFLLYAKTQTSFGEGKPNIIDIRNHEGTKLDPEEFGHIGNGSEGRLAVKLSLYTQGRNNAGVSVFLDAVKLTKFVAYEGKGGGDAFGSESGDVDAGSFKKEKSGDKKDKKKKKKKSK